MAGSDGAQHVLEEIELVKKNLPSIEIQTTTVDFCTFVYSKLPNRRIKLTLNFPASYPACALIVDIAAERGVPPGLKKKLENELGQVAAINKGGYHQVEPVLARLQHFVDNNKFLACWKEIKQIIDVIKKLSQAEDTKGSTISINDIKGLIKLKLCYGKYYYSCSITIDDAYPTTASNHNWGKACLLVKGTNNLAPEMERKLTIQAQELVRRMQDGMSVDNALLMSNPIKPPKGMESQKTSESTGLRNDTGKVKHKAPLAKKSTNDQVLSKIELSEWQAEEQSLMAHYNVPSYDGSDPQPSLMALVTFLVNKVQRLPAETCPVCKELSMPTDPKELLSFYEPPSLSSSVAEKRAHKMAQWNRPIRTHCGCWYHYKCLNVFMTQPPFGAACPRDDCRVYHPDWPDDKLELERAWAMKQAKEREIADAALAFM